MAALCFAGLYLVRSGQWVTGVAIALLSAFFVLKTDRRRRSPPAAGAVLIFAGRVFGGVGCR